MNFRHKKLVAMLALASQGLGGFGGFAAKADATEAPDEAAETVVSIGFSLNEADSDSVPLPETGDETGPASRTVPRAAKLVIPLVGGAALLAGLAAFVGYRIFQSIVPKWFTQVFTDTPGDSPDPSIRTVCEVLGSRLSLLLDIFGRPYRSLLHFFRLEGRADNSFQSNICVVGNVRSGKDSIVSKALGKTEMIEYVPSFGVSFETLYVRQCEVFFWVVAGGKDNHKYIPGHLRNADAVFVVISLEENAPADTAEQWFNICKPNIGSDVPFVFILNKTDLKSGYSVDVNTIDTIRKFMGSTPWFIYTASAINNTSEFVAWSGVEEPAPA
jgi:hypothetical protein